MWMNPFVQKNQMFYIYKQIVLWILLNYLKYILNLLLDGFPLHFLKWVFGQGLEMYRAPLWHIWNNWNRVYTN